MSKTVTCVVAAVAIACTPQSSSPDAPIASVAPPSNAADAAAVVASAAVEASAPLVDAASVAAPPDASTPPRKRTGVSCSRDRECAAGLACCQTGFRGHCGGAYMPDRPQEPCVMLSTCAPAPCHPMDLPP